MRQLASYLVTPIFIVDVRGDLVYYNEPAELLLGRRYDETGELPLAEWSTVFSPYDDDGSPLPPEALPLVIALNHRRPAQRSIRIRGLDGIERRISVTAFPLSGELDRDLGAVAIFWEEPQ
jgi:PAS domain-containing protein